MSSIYDSYLHSTCSDYPQKSKQTFKYNFLKIKQILTSFSSPFFFLFFLKAPYFLISFSYMRFKTRTSAKPIKQIKCKIKLNKISKRNISIQMGQVLSSFWRWAFTSSECKVLILGLNNAGKTTILYKMYPF